jgi:hypothetical protein
VAVVLDGKTFADDTMVVALGVTLTGEKVVLGFVETSTENAKVCTQFLEGLKARGLRYEDGLLALLDIEPRLRRVRGHKHLPALAPDLDTSRRDRPRPARQVHCCRSRTCP